jgi:hypothetical protein
MRHKRWRQTRGVDMGGMNRLDRLISWLSPEWAHRRAQFRQALKQAQTPVEPRRDDSGWMAITDERNPLNPAALSRAHAERLEGKRRWL